jgi:hypothetical protein
VYSEPKPVGLQKNVHGVLGLPYLPTIMSSIFEAFFLICLQISRVNMLLELLKIEVSVLIRAASMLASIRPRKPE